MLNVSSVEVQNVPFEVIDCTLDSRVPVSLKVHGLISLEVFFFVFFFLIQMRHYLSPKKSWFQISFFQFNGSNRLDACRDYVLQLAIYCTV